MHNVRKTEEVGKFVFTGEWRKVGDVECAIDYHTGTNLFYAICPGKYNWVKNGCKQLKINLPAEDQLHQLNFLSEKK